MIFVIYEHASVAELVHLLSNVSSGGKCCPFAPKGAVSWILPIPLLELLVMQLGRIERQESIRWHFALIFISLW